jgi:gliding motility-associated-like protein
MKRIYIVLLFITLFFKHLTAQNEANVWNFGYKAGLDFNIGIPVVLNNSPIIGNEGIVSISDTTGEFLFGTDLHSVYDSFGNMQNGTGMNVSGMSGRAIVKWPGMEHIYYIFSGSVQGGFSYSLVDMTLNEGRGAVTDKNIPVDAAWDASDRVAVVKKENSEGVWVITRKFTEDALAAFLVDENGLNPNPVISLMPDREADPEADYGFIKISYDKKYLVSSYDTKGNLEICGFNPSAGTSEYMYTITQPINWDHLASKGIEFSPDSKYLYSCQGDAITDTASIYQLDMKLIADSALFMNSAILVAIGPGATLQLARDGKIYTTHLWGDYYWLSVIHQPWVRGIGCMYEMNAINMFPGHLMYCLPNTLVDYLLRFEWTGDPCQGYPIHFKPNFIPPPDSIVWNFDDQLAPGSLTDELSPTYSFQHSGIHEVKVDVWYPSGRYEHTSREIEILPSPQPDLGPDTLFCKDASLTLSANCDADFFTWSTGQFGVSSISVSDTGTYWVRGRFNDSGCEGYDTIHIGFHQPTIIDETNLVITPTTCNGASGSITGLTALGPSPFAFQWFDLSGNDYGTNIDATNLPAGQYQLTITDGNGCEAVSEIYTIEDAGNLQVTQVQTTRPHCFNPDGQITVHAFSPSGSMLEYSIDNGLTYQSDSVFTDLAAASYVVRVMDVNGCVGSYLDNPVSLIDIPGPWVVQVNITNEIDFLGNGVIEVVATGSTPVIYYSIDSSNTWYDSGSFYNLQAGTYYCFVEDENGCDTSFVIEIENDILTYLHIVTGEGGHCSGNTALVSVNVDNFTSVSNFHLKLSYNEDNLQCEGFTNVNVQLLDSLTGWVDIVTKDIHVAWNAPNAVTFPGTEKVADLVFTTINPGQGELAWYTGATESYFTNSYGNPIPAEFQTGEVQIYTPPHIALDLSKTVCEEQPVLIFWEANSTQPPIKYLWTYPNGDTTKFSPVLDNVTQADAGIYTLLVTDNVGCTDQKSIDLIVSEIPVAAFHGIDTLEMNSGEVLEAGTGMFSYIWNTGDTIGNTIIYTEGMYSVEMESIAGCLGSDSVYVKLVSEEIPDFEIYIPNAFSPNGDGNNDSFKIIFPNSTFNLQHSTLSIYDRWGGLIVETDGIVNGWDGKKNGKDCPGGVYVYKIIFSVDGVVGNQERTGAVMLVK